MAVLPTQLSSLGFTWPKICNVGVVASHEANMICARFHSVSATQTKNA